MIRFRHVIQAGWRSLLWSRLPLRFPSFGQVMACLSLLGLVGLGYLCGVSVMFFQLPTSDFMNKALTGVKAWNERGRLEAARPSRLGGMRMERVRVDKPDKTYDGFTLYTTTEGARATLIDMQGETVHQWELPFRKAWPSAPHVLAPVSDESIHWFRCHLYPNGDLLAIYVTDVDTPYGYGLVKLNKDSQLLWAYPGRVHHDIDVAEDGTLYTLSQKLERTLPAGLESLPSPYISDSLVVLSPDGKELANIPILDMLINSPYALMLALSTDGLAPVSTSPLSSVTPPPDDSTAQGSLTELLGKGDFIHANSVRVLSRALAPKFPLFKPGQVLISLRNLDTLAVVDTSTRSVVWAAKGIWRIQHDADFLDNGHLLVYDNSGSINGCRILEYDPVTQAIPWAYANENATRFTAIFRGMKQRLPNCNTLIIDPDNGRMFEVTLSKELVWECLSPRVGAALTGVRRFGPDELTFLKGKARARP
jgi:hypothetical protein